MSNVESYLTEVIVAQTHLKSQIEAMGTKPPKELHEIAQDPSQPQAIRNAAFAIAQNTDEAGRPAITQKILGRVEKSIKQAEKEIVRIREHPKYLKLMTTRDQLKDVGKNKAALTADIKQSSYSEESILTFDDLDSKIAKENFSPEDFRTYQLLKIHALENSGVGKIRSASLKGLITNDVKHITPDNFAVATEDQQIELLSILADHVSNSDNVTDEFKQKLANCLINVSSTKVDFESYEALKTFSEIEGLPNPTGRSIYPLKSVY